MLWIKKIAQHRTLVQNDFVNSCMPVATENAQDTENLVEFNKKPEPEDSAAGFLDLIMDWIHFEGAFFQTN